jgi:hypothetical protein
MSSNLPPDFRSVLQAVDTYDIPLGAIADDVRAELADLAIEQARLSRQGRICEALPAFRRAIDAAVKASEPARVTLLTLPSAPTDLFVFCRQSGGQIGALHDPVTRTFFDAYVGFVDAERWSALAEATPHRTRDVVFFASGPFEDLRSLWSRAMNWRDISASANSSHSPGALESVLDRLCASVPSSLSATWYRNADDNLAQQIRAACQRTASRSDPGHCARWSPPWEQSVEAAE